MYAARELSQLLDCNLQLVHGGGQQAVDLRIGAVTDAPLRATKLEAERDETLLCTVMDVAFDALPFLVGGCDDPGARLPYFLELRSRFGLQARVLESEARGCARVLPDDRSNLRLRCCDPRERGR